jgi:hypothetical protein
MKTIKKGGVIAIVDDSCPVLSSMARNLFSEEEKKKMPNFVTVAFRNAISALPKEINADFVKGVAEIAKKVIDYEKTSWPYTYYEREWLYKGHTPEEIIGLTNKVAPDKESFLIFVGVVLAEGEWLSRDGSEAVIEKMAALKPVLLAHIKSREEAAEVAKYAGYNGKAGMLESWF